MKRMLAAAALAAMMPTAHAQDKGSADFTHSAEFRVRDVFEQNESGNQNVEPSHHNGILQRFKLGLGFKANEKFSMTATLLQSSSWGQSAADVPAGSEGVGDRSSVGAVGPNQPNFLEVNEAYATWMMSDEFHAKIGRMNFTFGDGSIMSVNDWQQQPFAFDGVATHWETEVGRFQFFAFKYRDYSAGIGIPGGLTATTSDPQHDAYGVVYDLKHMPEWLKSLNAHIIQDVGDAVWGSATNTTIQSTQNISALRYGVGAAMAFGAFDVKADYEMNTGKNSTASATGVVLTDRTINQNMMQVEGGFSVPGLMGSRFSARYHMDSGTSAADAATKDGSYDPYFYDRLSAAGLMQLVGWGNLTDISVAWSLKPTDNLDAGVGYHMFSKTNSEDFVRPGMYGTKLFTGAQTLTTGSTASSNIGSEIDLWAEHRYQGGLSMLASVGEFMPGSDTKNRSNYGAGGPANSDTVTQFMVQGKLTF